MSGKKKPPPVEPPRTRVRLEFVAVKVGHKWGVGVKGQRIAIAGLSEKDAKAMAERCNKEF